MVSGCGRPWLTARPSATVATARWVAVVAELASDLYSGYGGPRSWVHIGQKLSGRAGAPLRSVMEATAAGVPLLLITADRPAHLVGSGANQTGDQAGILGPSALAVLRLGSESGDGNDWAAVVQRGVVLAEGRRTPAP